MSSLKVAFLSDWLSNPYKELLADHLAKQGAIVSEYYWSTVFIHKVTSGGIPDVLHFHTIHPFLIGKSTLTRTLKLCLFVAQLLLLRLLGTKAVWTVHEWTNKLGQEGAHIFSAQAVVLGRVFHAVITHCQTTQQDIARIFKLENSHKVQVVPHGNYLGYYPNHMSTAEARGQLGIAADDTVFLLFGDIYRYKGVLDSIEAFNRLHNAPATLLIAGLPKEDLLEQEIIAAIKHRSKIIFLSKRIPDDEVQLVMNAADGVLVPYNVFTTSGVAILAMSFAKACIAPDIGFFRDVLDEAGAFLYRPDTQDGLYQAMQQALDEKQTISTMGQYNLKVAKQWSWQFVATKTLEIYSARFTLSESSIVVP